MLLNECHFYRLIRRDDDSLAIDITQSAEETGVIFSHSHTDVHMFLQNFCFVMSMSILQSCNPCGDLRVLGLSENVAHINDHGEQCCVLTRDIVRELTGSFFSYVLSIRDASLAEMNKLKHKQYLQNEHKKLSLIICNDMTEDNF